MIHRDALWILKLRKEKVSKMTMKKSKTLQHIVAVAVVLLALLVFAAPVSAESTPVTDLNSLQAALSSVGNGGTIYLSEDISGVSSTIMLNSGNIFTLDLNGHKLDGTNKELLMITDGTDVTIINGTVESTSWVIVTNGGKLTLGNNILVNATNYAVSDSATVLGVIGSTIDAADYSVVTINEGTTLSGRYGVVVKQNATKIGPSESKYYVAYGVNITINGGHFTKYDAVSGGTGIWTLGNFKVTEGNIPKITINNVKMDGGLNNGIASMGYADITIQNADVTAANALGIKGGKIVINGGTFTSTGDCKDPADAHNNGSEDTGAALSITSNDGYAHSISVEVNGGTFTSEKGYAVYEGIGLVKCTVDNCNHDDCVEKSGNYFVKDTNGDAKEAAVQSYLTNLVISGGSFTSAQDKVISLTKSSNKKFVSAGIFNKAIDKELINDGKVCVETEDGKFTIADAEHSISVSATSVNFGTFTEGYSNVAGGNNAVSDVTITVENTGNANVTLQTPIYEGTKFIVGPYSDLSAEIEPGAKVTFTILPQGDLTAGTHTETITIQATPLSSSGPNGEFEVYDEKVITATFTVIEAPEEEGETVLVPTLPPITVDVDNEDGTVTIIVPEETATPKGSGEDAYLEIKTGTDSQVTLMISGYTGNNGQYTLDSNSEIAAMYAPEEPVETNAEFDDNTVALVVLLELEKVNATLPVFSFKYDATTAAKVTSQVTNVKPIAMLNATHNADAVDADLKSVNIIFAMDKALYEKHKGKFVLYHVGVSGTPEIVTGEPDVDTSYENEGVITLIFTSELGFSSYVLAVDTTPAQGGDNTGNNNQDTGNNTPNYNGGGGGKKPTTVTPTVPPTEEPTDDPTDVPGEQVPETPVTPETPEEPSTPAPILAVLAGLGAAVVLRRK